MSTTSSRRQFILILGALAAIGPLSIDMYLPSLPAIGQTLGADAASVQLTVTSYFIGLAFGQLAYGPISDRIGRKPPLLFGLALFTLASIGCMFARDVNALIVLRVLQALGGCAGMVVTRAMVRDRFTVDEMARVLSALVLVMGVAPILAPTLGGQVFIAFGWQAIFLILSLFGAACFIAVYWGVAETQVRAAPPLSFRKVGADYLRILRHQRFMAYALAGGSAQAGMFAYITASPFVFIDYFKIAPDHYGWLFGANAFGLIAGSQFNSRLLRRFKSNHVLRVALLVYLAAGLVLLASAITHIGGFWGVSIPLLVCISSLGFTFPNAQAGAMAPFGDRAGMASAMLGTLQFTLAGISSIVVGLVHTGDAVGMAGAIAGCGLLAQLVLLVLVKSAKQQAA